MSTLRKRDTEIPRRPLLWLAAALLFTLPPLFDALAPWVPVLLLATIVAKFWMEPRGYRLRFAWIKLLLAAAALGAIYVSYSAITGMEPGVSLVAVLMALKILEAHTAREFQFMVMLGFVLCLCGFFLVQDLAPSVCLLLAFGLLTAALVQFHRRSLAGGIWPSLRTSGILLAQALPLMILLFLIFPRIATGFRLFAPNRGGASGFSDRLSPGSVASLATSTAVAFRAEFPDGNVPRADDLYWRGVVMSQSDGLEWRAVSWPAASRNSEAVAMPNSVRQWITIEPHDAHWMFALDWPDRAPPGAILAPGNYLWSWQTIIKPRRYEVTSARRPQRQELRTRERQLSLEVPTTISPAVRELAASFIAGGADPRAIVQRGLEFLRTQRFRYSLSPGEYRKNDLEEFLLRRRIGFCEHYAASFATLMRLAGVPARVVVGYLGGEWNEMGRFFLVRQTDTHAWCEVWLPENGWMRVDPTSVVAPERFNFAAYLDQAAAASGNNTVFTRALGRQSAFGNIRAAWQWLNYTWDTRVLSFDNEAQRSLMNQFGFTGATPFTLLLWSALFALGVIAVIAGTIHFRGQTRPDAVKLLYARFCKKAARLGAVRAPAEGPLDFANRAARALPREAERIVRISTHYVLLRYAAHSEPSALQQLTREVERFGSKV